MAIEAELIGKLHLVEIVVIKFGPEARVIVRIGECDPGGSVAPDGVQIDVPVGHEMEIEKLHGPVFLARSLRMLLPTA
jgi:hypothetical protein